MKAIFEKRIEKENDNTQERSRTSTTVVKLFMGVPYSRKVNVTSTQNPLWFYRNKRLDGGNG